jgi:hypothetical protein
LFIAAAPPSIPWDFTHRRNYHLRYSAKIFPKKVRAGPPADNFAAKSALAWSQRMVFDRRGANGPDNQRLIALILPEIFARPVEH